MTAPRCTSSLRHGAWSRSNTSTSHSTSRRCGQPSPGCRSGNARSSGYGTGSKETHSALLRSQSGLGSNESGYSRSNPRRSNGSRSSANSRSSMNTLPDLTSETTHGTCREIRLVEHPTGRPGENLFEVAETAIPDPAENHFLIRNAYFSVDPYMRPRIGDTRAYVAPYTLGEAMSAGAVGRVV